MENIGQKIKSILKEKRITIKELADGVEVSEPAIYKMLRTNNFKVKTLNKIESFLNINSNSLNSASESKVEVKEKSLPEAMVMLEILKEIDKKTQLATITSPAGSISMKLGFLEEFLNDEIFAFSSAKFKEILGEPSSKTERKQSIEDYTKESLSTFKKLQKYQKPLSELSQALDKFFSEAEIEAEY